MYFFNLLSILSKLFYLWIKTVQDVFVKFANFVKHNFNSTFMKSYLCTVAYIFEKIAECFTNKPCRVFHIYPVPPGRRAGAFLGQSPGPMGTRDSPFDPRPSPSPAPYLSRATAPRTSSLARCALLVVHPPSLQLPTRPVQDLPVSVSYHILQHSNY